MLRALLGSILEDLEINISFGGSEHDEDESREKLAELSQFAAHVQVAVRDCPSLGLAQWHLTKANEWHASGSEKLLDDKFDKAYRDALVGMFHANVAVELVAEYKYEVARLKRVYAQDTTAEFKSLSRALDESEPDYCGECSDEINGYMVRLRRLSLYVARAHALHDALIAPKYPYFTDGLELAANAVSYIEAAESAKGWDIEEIASDGLFFAHTSILVSTELLADNDIDVSFASTDWTDDNEHDTKTENDMRTAAKALAWAHAELAGKKGTPITAYFLGQAEERWAEAYQKYWDESWDDASTEADEAYFEAMLAYESTMVFADECASLRKGGRSTFLDEIEEFDPDYTEVDGEVEKTNGSIALRELALKAVKVQALVETRCPGFTAGATHLQTALSSVKRADDQTDWERVEELADEAANILGDAVDAANAYIGALAQAAVNKQPAADEQGTAPVTVQPPSVDGEPASAVAATSRSFGGK